MKKNLLSILLLFMGLWANAQFVPGNLVVLRIGDGTAALGSTATQVNLVEFAKNGSVIGTPLSAPTVVNGANRILTQSGSATSEGALSLSADRQYLTVVGYDAALGTVGVVGSASNRTIGRVDATKTLAGFNTSTVCTGYTANNIRSGVTNDGTGFWTGGTATSDGGVRYFAFGTSSSGTQLSTTITNTRIVNIFNGQLYVSASSGAFQSASLVGTGLPTTSGQTIVQQAGLPTTGGSPYGYVFFDREPSVPGVDLLYVADQQNTTGIRKYSFDGSTWTLRGNIPATGGATGITGFYNCATGNIELYATIGTTAGNFVYRVTDNAGYNFTMQNSGTTITSAANATLLATAPANTAFRGIAFSPNTLFDAPTAFAVTGGGTFCQGDVGFAVGLANSQIGVNYQLVYNGTTNIGAPVAGTGAAISFGVQSVGGTYTVVATNALTNCTTTMTGNAILNEVTLVTPSVSIATASTSICPSQSVTFTATPVNGGTTPSYQWKVNGVNAGTDSPTFTTSSLNNSDVVTVVMTSNANSGCFVFGTNPATSNSITITVNPIVNGSISIAASATTICAGASVTFTATPTNGGASPIFQWKKNGVNVGTNSATYTDAGLTNGNTITCELTSNANCIGNNPSTSNTITMVVTNNVTPTVSITQFPAGALCIGTNATFTATSTNGGTPSFQWKKNGTNVATGSTYTTSSLVSGDVITCVLTSSVLCVTSNTATSNAITVTTTGVPTISSFTPTSGPEGTVVTINGTNFSSLTSVRFNGLVSSFTIVNSTQLTATVPVGATTGNITITNGCGQGTSGSTFTVNVVQGLQNVVVEKYYVSDATDATGSIGALPAGSVTYRIYADMLPGYKFQAAYGVPAHELKLNTTTSFFNNEDYGSTAPTFSKTNAAKNSVMLDSWLSAGAAASGQFGVLKSDDDGVANVVNNTSPQILQNADPSAGIPLTVQDGLIAGTPEAITFVGITPTVFDNVSNVGNSLSTFNGSWASLNGSTGPNADTNRVLIAQITTDGCFSYELNLQIGTPSGGIQNYVANNATGNEIALPSLTFASPGTIIPTVSIAASATTICSGTSVTFTATAVNGGTGTYQWKKNGVNVGTNSATYTDAGLTNGNTITCTLTSNAQCVSTTPVVSNTITMVVTNNVTPTVSITQFPAGALCIGTNATFTATSTNGGTPSFQWKKNGTNVATGSAYTTSTLVSGDVITCVLTSSVLCVTSNTATSNAITVTTTGVPTISSFTPTSGPEGTVVTINGTNFSSLTSVRFNGLVASYTIVNSTQLTATVPVGATTGNITITNGCGQGTSGSAFTVNVVQGLQNVVVEKYYVSNAADATGSIGALPAGSVTYRIYADMLPGYKFQAAYGVPAHELKLNTTTSFFNNEDYGSTAPTFSKTNAAKNSVMLDSWLSAGAAASGQFGVLKSDDDGVANVVNNTSPQILQNADPSAGIPLTVQDGLIAGTPEAVTFVGITPTVFDNVSNVGNSFSTFNGSWASLNGSTGPNADTNRVLIAQITTDGCFSYELNLQIGTPSGGIQNYVANNATGNEIALPSLMYTSPGTILPTVSIAASATTICAGASVTFTATTVNGGTPTYQWKKNGVNVGTNSATYTDAGLTNGNTITCTIVSNAQCISTTPVTSNTITMVVTNNVTPTVSITQFPSGALCIGTNATFTATSTNGGTPSFQWKKNGTNVATGSAYTTSSLVSGDVITCVLTSSVLCVTSNTATSNAITVTTTGVPTISSFTPTSGPEGTVVTINGTNFSSLTSVRFNGLVASYTIVNSTQLTATVPVGATTGNITITNGCGQGTSGSAFTVNVVQGLQNVVVEKYYVSNAADATGSIGALPAGSVTYRIYADMLPGYKFQAAYGVPAHELKLNTTTSFFNNEDYGSTAPTFSKTNAAKNSVMLDSWLSAGAAASGQFGVLKSDDDGVANVVNNTSPQILQNADPSAGIPLTVQDGLIAGTPEAITFVGITPTVFDNVSNVGNSLSTFNGSWASLNGSTGPNADTNRVLIAQITTDGCFSYELNLQIGTPSGGIQNYVANNATGNEIALPSLTFASPGTIIPTVSIAASATTICSGTSVTFTATAVNGGTGTYQWKKNGVNVGTNSATYTDAGLTNGNTITCTLTSNAQCVSTTPVVSNTITMVVTNNVTPTVSITQFPAGALCIGTNATFTATSTNGGTPSFQWKKNGTNVATGSAYTTSTLVSGDVITCVLTSSVLCVTSNTATSNAITVTTTGVPTISSFTPTSGPEGTVVTINGTNFSSLTSVRFNGLVSSFTIVNSTQLTATVPVGATTGNITITNGCGQGTSGSAFTVNVVQGLQNVVVEKYYVSNAADATGSIGALPAGSVTYRIYADMLPGYKFQAAYGVPAHELKLNTTTSFFNNEDYGSTAPTFSKTNAAKNSVMLDSWLSAGAAASGQFGILKSDDNGVANVVNNTSPQILQNADPSAGIPLTVQDGLISGTPEAVTFVGITPTVFDNVSNVGNSFSTFNGSWASLNGSTGPNADTNRVLIAQITTDGCFSYELNLQIGTPSGGIQNYVANNATGNEIALPSLTFSTSPTGTASVSIISSTSNTICSGTPVTFTASPLNGGLNPSYQWKKNGVNVGTNSTTYIDNTLTSTDQILVVMTPSGCSTGNATSNTIITSVTAPIIVTSFAPTSGAIGSTVVITGSGFTGATSVSFNGTAAITYTVDNDLQITATVPAGATTGTVTVNVGSCSGVSTGNFTVISTGTLNLKAYIQGYLDVLTTTMASVMSNQTGSLDLTEVDNITVEFHDATAPYALAATSTVMLYTNGTATVTIPGSLIGGSYYIAIKHRSAIETWSANPVSLTTVTAYDFTTSSSQAFGDNMVEGPTGVWSLYTGDVDNTLATATQDGLIDLSDFLLLDIDVQNFTGGYVATDLNGNGLVDLDDFLIQDANVQNFISVAKP